jgi:hypothetical protein
MKRRIAMATSPQLATSMHLHSCFLTRTDLSFAWDASAQNDVDHLCGVNEAVDAKHGMPNEHDAGRETVHGRGVCAEACV